MVRHGGSSAGSYLTDPTSPIPSHCASIVVTSTLRVNSYFFQSILVLHNVSPCWSTFFCLQFVGGAHVTSDLNVSVLLLYMHVSWLFTSWSFSQGHQRNKCFFSCTQSHNTKLLNYNVNIPLPIRPHVKWAVSLVSAGGHFCVGMYGLIYSLYHAPVRVGDSNKGNLVYPSTLLYLRVETTLLRQTIFLAFSNTLIDSIYTARSVPTLVQQSANCYYLEGLINHIIRSLSMQTY